MNSSLKSDSTIDTMVEQNELLSWSHIWLMAQIVIQIGYLSLISSFFTNDYN